MPSVGDDGWFHAKEATGMVQRLLAGVSAVVLVVALAGGHGAIPYGSALAQDTTPSAAGKRVAVLFPGLVDDQSWNQAGFEGLKRAEAEGAEIAYTERVNQSQQVEVFRNYAQQGYDIIVGHGGEYMDAALQVASEYPDLQFVVTNGNRGAANVTSFTLNYRDMGVLAGALAGLMTETNEVAVVAGQEIPVALGAVEGFREGVARVNPEAEVNVTYTGSWEDVDKAREAALALIADGADVLWHVLDAADAGVLSAADDEGVMAIGLYADQSHLAPEAHIGAVDADASRLVYDAATKSLDGQVHDEGIAAGVVGIGHFSDRVPQEVQDQVKAIEEELKSAPIASPTG
jgi:basic membrane protein A and related proteins